MYNTPIKTNNISNSAGLPSPISPQSTDNSKYNLRNYVSSSGSEIQQQQQLSNSTRRNSSQEFYNSLVEFVPNLVYFGCLSEAQKRHHPRDAFLFPTDDHFNYIRFYLDFGPPNMAQTIKFWKNLRKHVQACQAGGKRLVAIVPALPDKCTNATLLMCLFMILEYGCTPAQALFPISDQSRIQSLVLARYRDAGYGAATYWLDIADLVHAFYAGVRQLNLINVDKFDTDEYEFNERVENGDLGWIIPGYFLAMATPHEQPLPHLLKYHQEVISGRILPLKATPPGMKPLIELNTLADYLREKANVKAVVRLNNKLYDRERFIKRGVDHFELFFPDGSVPEFETIVKTFLLICDNILPPYPNLKQPPPPNTGALAVHCKAGLGRTGTLICCWMIRTFGWSARQCISWCRLMRPGSVVGPQQNWLESVEKQLMQMRHVHHLRNDHHQVQPIDVNTGDEELAHEAMGLQVPVQPRKENRASEQELNKLVNATPEDYNVDSQLHQVSHNHHYNLRASAGNLSHGGPSRS